MTLICVRGCEAEWSLYLFLQNERTVQNASMNDADLLNRIAVNAAIFGGKPIIRGRRLAVEHVLACLAVEASQRID